MPKSIGETDFLDESKVHAHPRLSIQRGFDFLDEVRMHPRLNAWRGTLYSRRVELRTRLCLRAWRGIDLLDEV